MNPDVNLQESVHENTFGVTWRARWTISLHPLDLSHISYWSSEETSVKGGGRVGAEGQTWEGDRVFFSESDRDHLVQTCFLPASVSVVTMQQSPPKRPPLCEK